MDRSETRRSILVSPGPVHVFVGRPDGLGELHHRSAAFRDVVRETTRLLRELLRTSSEVHLVTASGTGAMEAAVANVTAPGSRALVVSGGKFGDRWAEICDAYECRTSRMSIPWGKAIDAGEVAETIARERPDAVFVTHVESSTGLLFPLAELCSLLPAGGPLLVVDAVSSVGAEELDMDRWRIDAAVGASQKSLAAPAGMSFVALGPRAVSLAGARARGRYYFDLARARASLESGDTPFTPAIETVELMHRALGLMNKAGFDEVMRRHGEASRAFVEAAGHLGLRSFPERPSSAVQVLSTPPGCAAGSALGELARAGFVAAGGQGRLEGAVIRTGFLGLFGRGTLRRLVEALAGALEATGRGGDRAAALGCIEKYPYEGAFFGPEDA